MLLVYTQKNTPRIAYTFKQICKRILGIEVGFTSKIETFIAHDGAKISYGKQPLGKELYIQSAELLFEHGFNDVEIYVQQWEETKCFFSCTNKRSALPFDIFAATFYLLSRYEEYLPHVKDEYGRFMAEESIAYQHNFLHQPVVDIWAYKFKTVLQTKFPDIDFKEKDFAIKPVIAVSQTFAYKRKGILRSIGGGLRDVSRFKIREVLNRINVLLGIQKDPNDTFTYLIKTQREKKKKFLVLFGLGDYSNFEKNINANRTEHKILIKYVADYIEIGLKVSYDAIKEMLILKKEKRRIENIVNRPLKSVLCAFYKINLPEAYRNFVGLEISRDYSMGFPKYMGFRAGTCTPFMFYDLDYEVQTPLVVHSFCFTNQALENIEDLEIAKDEIKTFVNEIKKVRGTFIPIFSNGLFGRLNNDRFWKSIFEYILDLENN
ncbi:DUF7033 domain-containing protein [Aquimarina rhabdastrellae]